MGLPAFMATFIKRGKMKRNVKDRKHAYAKKLIPVFKAEAVKLAKQSGARSQEPGASIYATAENDSLPRLWGREAEKVKPAVAQSSVSRSTGRRGLSGLYSG